METKSSKRPFARENACGVRAIPLHPSHLSDRVEPLARFGGQGGGGPGRRGGPMVSGVARAPECVRTLPMPERAASSPPPSIRVLTGPRASGAPRGLFGRAVVLVAAEWRCEGAKAALLLQVQAGCRGNAMDPGDYQTPRCLRAAVQRTWKTIAPNPATGTAAGYPILRQTTPHHGHQNGRSGNAPAINAPAAQDHPPAMATKNGCQTLRESSRHR